MVLKNLFKIMHLTHRRMEMENQERRDRGKR